MIKADKNKIEGLHLMGEIQSKEKFDLIRSSSDLIRVSYSYRFLDKPSG
jgi:hypothetical protein